MKADSNKGPILLAGSTSYEIGEGWARLEKRDEHNGFCYYGTILIPNPEGLVLAMTKRNTKLPNRDFTVLEMVWQGRVYVQKTMEYFPPAELKKQARRFVKEVMK